jgi:hypothetical protein
MERLMRANQKSRSAPFVVGISRNPLVDWAGDDLDPWLRAAAAASQCDFDCRDFWPVIVPRALWAAAMGGLTNCAMMKMCR